MNRSGWILSRRASTECRVSPRAFDLFRYFFRMAETSIEILTLSPTNRLPLPSAWLNFISKSLRFRNPWISAPARSLPHGSVSYTHLTLPTILRV